MALDPFTINKAKVREVDFVHIKRHFKEDKGKLRYMGLPGRNLVELTMWSSFFCHFSAVERGKGDTGYVEQHHLLLTAMQTGLSDRIVLLRGEMDEILLNGKDDYQTPVQYPFDVVSLDYSGGVLYKDKSGKSKRVESISRMLGRQADFDKNFLLFISCNLDYEDHGEIKRVLGDFRRELAKIGIDANTAIQRILNHEKEETRLKIYIPYLIKSLSDAWYKCDFMKPIYYLGNRETSMMHFAFWLKRTSKYSAGKLSISDLLEILNLSTLRCHKGKIKETDFGIPKILG